MAHQGHFRFSVGESVRLTTPIKELHSSNTLPAGNMGDVQEVLQDGSQYRVVMTGSVVSGYEVVADESQLVEASRPVRKPSFDNGARVHGFVERIAEREGGGVFMALLTLRDRHESFVVLASTSEDEYSLRLTRRGDKVSFVVAEADADRPRVKGFLNYALY